MSAASLFQAETAARQLVVTKLARESQSKNGGDRILECARDFIEINTRHAIAEAAGDRQRAARLNVTLQEARETLQASFARGIAFGSKGRGEIWDTLQQWADAHARRHVWEETGHGID